MARVGLPVVGVVTAKNQLHNLNAWKKIGFLEYAGIYSNRTVLKSINKKEFYLSSFGEDEEGELYIINYSGQIYSITK